MSGGDMIGAVHESGATWADGPRKFEAGTRNVGGEVGFAAAIDYMKGIGWEAMETHEHALLDRMLAGMRAMPTLPYSVGAGHVRPAALPLPPVYPLHRREGSYPSAAFRRRQPPRGVGDAAPYSGDP